MDFIVNREQRKEIIKSMRKELTGGAKALCFTSKLFLILAVITFVAGTVMSILWYTDELEILVIAGVSAIAATFVWVISYDCMKNYICKKMHWNMDVTQNMKAMNFTHGRLNMQKLNVWSMTLRIIA